MESTAILSGKKFGVQFQFGGPVVVGILVVCGGFYLPLNLPAPKVQGFETIEPQFHSIDTIEPVGGKAVSVQKERPMSAEVSSAQEWFEILVRGEFYGRDFDALWKRFGGPEKVPVYVWVAEEFRQDNTNTKGLYWLQRKENGKLDVNGFYRAGAHLAGTGQRQARPGDVFSIRICIPRQDVKLEGDRGVSSDELFRNCLYLTTPFYVITQRPSGYQP